MTAGVAGLLRQENPPFAHPPLGAEIQPSISYRADVHFSRSAGRDDAEGWRHGHRVRQVSITSSVQRMLGGGTWPGSRIAPRQFKLSNDPQFAAKLHEDDVYVDPPAHTVVLSIDERARSRRSTAPSRDCP